MGFDTSTGKIHVIVFKRAGMYVGVPIGNVLEAYKINKDELINVPCVNYNIAGLFVRHNKAYYIYDIFDYSSYDGSVYKDYDFPCIILQGIEFCGKSIRADDVFGTLSYIKQEVKGVKQHKFSSLLHGYLQKGDKKILLPDMRKILS